MNDPRPIVDAWYRAMQRGPLGEDELVALFAEDGVYVEPFSGAPRTHRGQAAIRACFQGSWAQTPPDLTITVDRVDLQGTEARVQWTCHSPVFPAPVRGEDEVVVRDGRIVRLETRFTGGPG